MLTIRCKVIEQGDYSIVVTIPKTLDIINHMKIRSAYDCNLWVIKDDLVYPYFDIKDVIYNDTIIVLYFGNYTPSDFDLVNDKSITTILQNPISRYKSIVQMLEHGSDMIYESN